MEVGKRDLPGLWRGRGGERGGLKSERKCSWKMRRKVFEKVSGKSEKNAPSLHGSVVRLRNEVAMSRKVLPGMVKNFRPLPFKGS